MRLRNCVLYERGGTLHIRDEEGHHWTVQRHWSSQNPYHREIEVPGIRAFGRPTGNYTMADSAHALGHGLMNFVLQEGAWAWYTGWGGTKRSDLMPVGHGYIPQRRHIEEMNAATTAELGVALTATEYARRGHGAWGTSGHANINYEWCHLVSHGLRGGDDADNIVVATKYQNTEQLILEAVLYKYRTEDLSIRVTAKLARGTWHLAESVYYEILSHTGVLLYARTMDARRSTNVSYTEMADVSMEVCRSINRGLRSCYPTTALMSPELLAHARENFHEQVEVQVWMGIA